jgi:benzoylsuccinyl-CoA thiolase BbsB subunit
MTKFGRHADVRMEDLGHEACTAAIRDAGIDQSNIEAAYCGHCYQGMTAGQRVLRESGIGGIPIINIEDACSSSSIAFSEAYHGIASGRFDMALAIGVEKMPRGLVPLDRNELDIALGKTMPADFAMTMRLHMRDFGTTLEQVAMVAVKNRRHAKENPKAQFRDLVSVEEVLKSRMIADPVTKLMCCPSGAGAAAALLVSASVATRSSRKPIRVLASAVGSGIHRELVKDGPAGATLAIRTAKKAYEQSGLGPQEVDVAEIHDCFAIAEICHTENLGFCSEGVGGRFVSEGRSTYGGDVVINPSGGLLAKGHPVGATGIGQIVEIVTQLRGEAGSRQVPDARIGLTHTMGGADNIHYVASAYDGGACSVHIFEG